jgi:tetratricopeptide (TPR) repeat protein
MTDPQSPNDPAQRPHSVAGDRHLIDTSAPNQGAQGDYAAARSYYEHALAIREQALGPTHPDTAQSLNNLAMLLYDQDQLDQAVPLVERAVAISMERLGASHPDTKRTLGSLDAMRQAAQP